LVNGSKTYSVCGERGWSEEIPSTEIVLSARRTNYATTAQKLENGGIVNLDNFVN